MGPHGVYHCGNCGNNFRTPFVIDEDHVYSQLDDGDIDPDDLALALDDVGEDACPRCFSTEIDDTIDPDELEGFEIED